MGAVCGDFEDGFTGRFEGIGSFQGRADDVVGQTKVEA
jgi:hypothetical protein